MDEGASWRNDDDDDDDDDDDVDDDDALIALAASQMAVGSPVTKGMCVCVIDETVL